MLLYHDRTNLSKGINLTKSNNNKECKICHHWLFNHGFKFQDSIWSGCHDLTMLCLNLSDIAIISVKGGDYCYIIHDISTPEAIILLKHSVLEDCAYI